MTTQFKNILIMTSVDAEREAIQAGLYGAKGIDIMICGVGMAQAAAQTAIALTRNTYDAVINMGICGGFRDKSSLGSIVIGTDAVAVELGTETDERFISLEELGFGNVHYEIDSHTVDKLQKHFVERKIPVSTGPILTVSSITGTTEAEYKLKKRVKGAAGEAMEGFGVATAAHINNIPFFEIRAVSNFVGPRDRDAWKIKEALESLSLCSKILPEVFQ